VPTRSTANINQRRRRLFHLVRDTISEFNTFIIGTGHIIIIIMIIGIIVVLVLFLKSQNHNSNNYKYFKLVQSYSVRICVKIEDDEFIVTCVDHVATIL